MSADQKKAATPGAESQFAPDIQLTDVVHIEIGKTFFFPNLDIKKRLDELRELKLRNQGQEG